MIQIQKTKSYLTVAGHAADAYRQPSEETKMACTSVTTLVNTLIACMREFIHDKPSYKLSHGQFILNLDSLADGSLACVQMFMIGVRMLARQYPDMIGLYDNCGNKIGENECKGVSEFPDWQQFVIKEDKTND